MSNAKPISATLAEAVTGDMESPLQSDRDLRLDLFRGAALWAIFLDHIPQNVMQWATVRNYGFSDAADLFVFISGYTTSFVYARIMLNRGFVVGATRLFKRVGQLYSAHIILFVVYVAAIGFIARRFHIIDIIHEFNIAGLIASPIQALLQGLLLRFKPLNLDVLPLYIVLMTFFPPVLWLMLRKPGLAMLGSLMLYLAARQFEWNLSGYPAGVWYFNPFTWQLLFVFGAWCALGGTTEFRFLGESRVAFGRRLPAFRTGRNDSRSASEFWRFGSRLAAGSLHAERQDQPCSVPLRALRCFCLSGGPADAQRLVRTSMAGVFAGHQVRPAISSGVLRRDISVVRRPLHRHAEFCPSVGASIRQSRRDSHHDRRRLLRLMVEETGQNSDVKFRPCPG